VTWWHLAWGLALAGAVINSLAGVWSSLERQTPGDRLWCLLVDAAAVAVNWAVLTLAWRAMP
jgi:hypothetical protein